MKKSVLQNIKSAFNLSYLALIVLFCFAVSTGFMSINYMAKYSSVSSGSDGARAARFVIDVFSDKSTELSIDASNDGSGRTEYTFIVSNSDGENTSEVGQGYDVVMTLTKPLPESIAVQIGDVSPSKSADGLKYTFSDVGSFSAETSKENEHTLTFIANEIEDDYNITDIKLEVYVEQVE